MVRYAALILTLMTLSTSALAQIPTSVSSPGLNCVQPTAVGNGTADDTVALQNAFNTAEGGLNDPKRAVCLQPGKYKFTSNLTLPSRVSVYGLSGSFNEGVQLLPANGARLIIDGAQQPGGWQVRSTLSNLTFILTSAQSGAILINQSYHLTFDRVAIYQAHRATSAALSIANITTFVCNFCVVWGNQAAPAGTGVLINSGGDAQIQMNSPNIEGMNIGMSVTNSQLTMIEPWFEKNITGYVHNTAFGVGGTRILGGKFSLPTSGSAVGIDVQGDHLFVQGTTFNNLASNVSAYGFSLPKSIYTDVKIMGIPSISAANIFQPGANLLGVQVDPPRPARMTPARIHFSKQVDSGAVTDVLRIKSFNQFGRFRLVLTAFAGNGFQTKQFDFGVTAGNRIGNTDPIVSTLSTSSSPSWDLRLGALQLTPSGSDLIVKISATSGGTLGVNARPFIVGELEVLRYEPGGLTGSINVL
jgi:hypothetical protein